MTYTVSQLAVSCKILQHIILHYVSLHDITLHYITHLLGCLSLQQCSKSSIVNACGCCCLPNHKRPWKPLLQPPVHMFKLRFLSSVAQTLHSTGN